MARTTYSAQFKTKLVLEVLKEEKELGTIASENGINPNMLRNWKREFLENASAVFEDPKRRKNRPNGEMRARRRKPSGC